MSLRYEVIKRLCPPSGATLPSLLSLPWLWGSPALSGALDWRRGEARSPPTRATATATATVTGQSGKCRALPQPPSHGIIKEVDLVPAGRPFGSDPADNPAAACDRS